MEHPRWSRLRDVWGHSAMGPKLFGRRPDLWNAAIQAILTFAISVGVVRLTGEQVGYLFTAITAVISLIVGQSFTPNAEVQDVIEAGQDAIAAKNAELQANAQATVASASSSEGQ